MATGVLLYVFARRLTYPYDLEWMEGGMLCHALRLMEGKPIYAAPSVDFIPYLYTPLYPFVLFLLSKVVGLGYTVARLVSVLSFVAACVLGYRFAAREGCSRGAAACAMAIPAAAYVTTGAWYDLARPDSLFLLLVTAAVVLGWAARRSHLAAAGAAACMVAAFFAKQTATPFMIGIGAALLVLGWRFAMTYAATAAVLGLPALVWLDRSSHGWFWTYVFRLHQAHSYSSDQALATPGRLVLLLFPAILVVPWALVRRPRAATIYAAFIAAIAIVASSVAHGTQWAFINAYIPGIFFTAVATGVAAGQLLAEPRLAPRRAILVYLAIAAGILNAPGGLEQLARRYQPPSWRMDRIAPSGYDPRWFLPTAHDRELGAALIARLKAEPGEVLIPFHPFYARLAGKRTHLHRMGVLDTWRAGLGPPAGMEQAFAQRRFGLAIFDDKIEGNWQLWPGLLDNYRVVAQIRGPRCPSGATTNPLYVMTAIAAPGPGGNIDREIQ